MNLLARIKYRRLRSLVVKRREMLKEEIKIESVFDESTGNFKNSITINGWDTGLNVDLMKDPRAQLKRLRQLNRHQATYTLL